MSKRRSNSERLDLKRQKSSCCIIHMENSNMLSFIYLNELDDPGERFRYICDVRNQRLEQAIGSSHRMQAVCDQIPPNFGDVHGYHRDCYQHFTMNLSRLKPAAQTVSSNERRRSTRTPSKTVLFDPKCIFCGQLGRKKVKKGNAWTTKGLSSFDYGGGQTIIKLAEERGDTDLARRVRGFDLFAKEAKYHTTCRRNYTVPSTWQSKDADAKEHTQQREEAHNTCFAKICEFIDQKILNGKQVVKMTQLCDLYIQYLSGTPFANPNYKTQTLKSRLMRHEIYSQKISFVGLGKTGGKFQSDLVFSNDTSLLEAVKNGYLLGCSDMLQDVGILLRNVIKDAFEKKHDNLPWPPTASYLQTVEDPVPEELQKFLRTLISGQGAFPLSEKTERLMSSIGQDLCRAATNCQWKLPKHILVCMTLRHLFRSSQLNTLMNRLGHAESYSFSLELETALANALEEASSVLTPQIIRKPSTPSLFHSDFDNFDQYVNDLSGSGSVHTSHGIMLQNIPSVPSNSDIVTDQPVIQTVPQMGVRSLKSLGDECLPPCYINQRDSPVMKIVRLSQVTDEEAMSRAMNINRSWCIFRLYSSENGQVIPAWAGYISETGKVPNRLTTIDYYPVINHPITDYATVKECLRVSREASKEVGQLYAITTFDLGVCMKAYPIIWKSPDYYADHIVLIGIFHLASAYLKIIGKKMNGSGFVEVLLESGLMSSGSMEGVMSGKNYARSIHCHKVMAETIERCVLERYCENTNSKVLLGELEPESMVKVQYVLKNREEETLAVVMNDPAFTAYLRDYSSFRQGVSSGSLGKTAQFWLTYADHVWLVLSLLQAVKINDYCLYRACLCNMADLFFCYDGKNYARYLTYFSLFLANIEETHPGATELLKLGAISVARSYVPGNMCPVDKTIEETFMRHAKSRSGPGGRGAGVSGLLNNYEAYRRWARTAHERSKYMEVMLQMADMTEESRGNKHRDARPSQIKKSESDTTKVLEAFETFLNPFKLETADKLYRIASGAAAPPGTESDITKAKIVGRAAKEAFIEDRLKKNERFFEPIPKKRLKTFADMVKTVVVRTSTNREVQYKQQANVAFQLLEKIEMLELLKYPLMPVPSSIGTADGYLFKKRAAWPSGTVPA